MYKIIFAFLTLGFMFSSCSSDEKVINVGQNIHHDDFEYSVQNVEKIDSIGLPEVKGTLVVVTFKVENQAKRVNHKWDNSIAYVVDNHGKVYENSNTLQKALKRIKGINLKDEYITPAGESESAVLVFEVPKDSKELFLKVRGEFLMGDLFDGNQFEHTRVKLF